MTRPETRQINGPRPAVPQASLTQPVPSVTGGSAAGPGSRNSVSPRACEALAVPCYGPTFD